MKKPHVQQRTERRISAALRLVMVAVLLVAQIALVFLLSDVLKQRMALAYSALELLAAVVAVTIWSRPGATSYKIGWVMLVLFVPVVGVILYLLRQAMPYWYPAAAGLDRKDFLVYRNTAVKYLPTGEAYLNTMLDDLEHAERFIFLEYFIVAEGEIWDRLSDILCRKSGQGVEVKLIFDDFGSMLRMPNEKVEALTRAGVEVKIFASSSICGSAWTASCTASMITTGRCTMWRRRAFVRHWWTARTTTQTLRRRICFCSLFPGQGSRSM